MKLSEIRRAGFDTETTSADPLTARIVTAALVFTGAGRDDQVFTWLINPGVEIPAEAAEIHGIDTARAVADGADPKVALEDIASKLTAALRFGMPVTAFNASFDITVLDQDLRRHDLAPLCERLDRQEPWTLLDPYVIDKAVDRYRRGKRKLAMVCEHYGISLEDWHTADADAWAALKVMDAIVDAYPDLGDMRPVELYAQQQAWARQQAASLQEYFRSEKAGDARDPDIVIDGSWPLKAAS